MEGGALRAPAEAARSRDAIAVVALAGAAFATSAPLARFARPVDPLVLAFGRLALAAAVLVAIEAPRLAVALRGASGRARLGIFAAGAVLAAHFACFQWGLEATSLPAAVSLVSLEPLSVVVCAWVLFGIRPSGRERLGVVLATAGAVVVGRAAGEGEHAIEGDLLVLAAVVLYGLYVSLARGLRDALEPRAYAALVYASASLVLAAALPFAPDRGARWPLAQNSLLAIALLALVPTLFGHTLVQTAARRLSPSVVALVSPLETLGAMALGASLLGCVPTSFELAGALLIVAGVSVAIVGPTGPRSGAEPGDNRIR